MTATTATILSLKTKNQIYKDFKSLVEAALTEFSINNWEVKKLHQIIKTEDLKPCVYIQILRKNQKGSQYRDNLKITDKTGDIYYKKYSVKQEVQIRFSATRREQISDTTATYNGVDILEIIKNYLQSDDGITLLAIKDYAQYRAGTVQEQTFTNDDENIQLMPYFDCEFLYTDEWQRPINKLDTVKEIYKKGV